MKQGFSRERIAMMLGYVLATSPVWYVPWTLYPAVFGKVPAFLVVLAMFLLFVRNQGTGIREQGAVNAPISDLRSPISARWLDRAVLGYVVVHAITAAFGVDPWQSLWGSESRATGFVLLLALALWYRTASRAFDVRSWRRFFAVSVVAACAESAIVFAEGVFPSVGRAFGETGRLSGLFGNPSYLAGYLVMEAFIAAALAARGGKRSRVLWSIMAALLAFATLLTGTRGAFLGLLAGIAFAGAMLFVRSPMRRTVRWGVALACAFLLAGTAAVAVTGVAVGRAGALDRVLNFRSYLDDQRLLGWGVAVDAIRERPVLGWGPEAYQTAFDRHYDPGLLKYSFYETVSDKPHDLILELLAGGGIILLAAYLALLLAAWRTLLGGERTRSSAIEVERIAITGAVVAYLVHALFLFETLPTNLLFFSILAWARERGVSDDAAPEARRLRVLPAAGLALAIGAFVALGPAAIPASASARDALDSARSDVFLAKGIEAMGTPSVHHAELAKQIVREYLKREAGGGLPTEDIRRTVLRFREAMERVVARNPGDFTAVFMLGQLQTAEGEYLESPEALQAAAATFESALALSPKRQAIPLQVAKVLMLEGHPDDAVELLKTVRDRNEGLYEPHWFYGLALAAAGRADEGADELVRAFRIKGEFQGIGHYRYVMDTLGALARYDEMIEITKRVLDSVPDAAEYHARLAAAYAKAGKSELAILEAQRAAELDPSYREEADTFIRTLTH